MNFFQQLQAGTGTERDYLLNSPVIQQAMTGKVSLPSYVAFLTQAYHHVKHTVPLLMACGARLPERLEWLRVAIAEYIREETGHQEWILNDIAACGADADAVRHGSPALPTELMVSYVYDRIARHNPVSFFGMVNVLEGTSIALATQAAGIIQDRLQLPARSAPPRGPPAGPSIWPAASPPPRRTSCRRRSTAATRLSTCRLPTKPGTSIRRRSRPSAWPSPEPPAPPTTKPCC